MQVDGSYYPILTIQPDWVMEEEAMGSKQKFWFRHADNGRDMLFKYPRANTGEHWAEKIAAEIAEELRILHAKVECACFKGAQGSATESFARKGRELYHGNQLLAGQVLGYDRAKKFGQSRHTLANIFAAFDRVFLGPESATAAKQRAASYFVLDALIGNTDRHHENWGILVKRTRGAMAPIITPSFDHASSLGRELLDDTLGKCRTRILREKRIGHYAENAPGAIYWNSSERRAPSPLELVRRAAAAYPELFHNALLQIGRLEAETFRSVVDRMPPDWMSEIARTFAIELLCYNLERLKEITP